MLIAIHFYKPLATAIAHWQCACREFRMAKKQEAFCAFDMEPRPLRCIYKETLQWSWILAFSPTQKSIKIITLRCQFFVVSSNFLMLDYMFSPSKKIHIYSVPSFPSSDQFLWAIWKAISWDKVLIKELNNLNLGLLHFAFIF